MTIELITTGGTIDKEYNPLTGELIFSTSFIASMLQQSRCQADIKITPLLAVDSLDMTDIERKILQTHIAKSSAKRILITHGTDTMAQTAAYIHANISDKTLVFMGAMIPFSIQQSDALFNLGAGVIAAQTLPVGCYIVMNGKVFMEGEVSKNKTKGCFESR